MKKQLSLLLCLILLCSLTACGANSSASMKTEAMYSAAPMAPMEESAAMDMAAGTTNSLSENGTSSLPEGRKWIVTINLDVETEDLDSLLQQLDSEIISLEGYVEDQNIHNGSNYASRRYRSANLTVRIPADRAEQFTGSVSGLANVTSQNLNREDITLQYVATSSRVTALETEEARLLELLAEAETMADLLEIEARLTDVRYELERHASQLRLYDNQVDYATVYLYISEVQEYTPVEEPTFFERIKTTFSHALDGLGKGIVNISVFLIGNSPYLLTFGILGFAAIKLMKRIKKPCRFTFRKKNKKEDPQQ